MRFTIPLAPVTKKNSQRIITNPRTGRPMIIQSEVFLKYEKAAACYIPRMGPICRPVNVKAIFYMPTRRRVDLVNLEEALLDILVKHELLQDDNCLIVVSMDGSRVEYDKENPRTEVEINDAV